MQDIEVVESLEAKGHLDQRFPDHLFVEGCVVFLVGYDFLVEVAVVQELHYDAASG
jgi:hypothetical protein